MARSTQWRDVAALGEAIVRELGLEDATDTLGRWMAHRAAELLHRARAAKSVQQRERVHEQIADLVLRIWRERSHWPQGWPPENAVTLMSGLGQGSGHPSRRESRQSPWLEALTKLDELHSREKNVLLDLAFADLSFSREKRLIRHLPKDHEERKTLEALIAHQGTAISRLLSLIGAKELPKDRGARIKATSAQFEHFEQERRALVASLVSKRRRAPGGSAGSRVRRSGSVATPSRGLATVNRP